MRQKSPTPAIFTNMILLVTFFGFIGMHYFGNDNPQKLIDVCPITRPKVSQLELITVNRKQLQKHLRGTNSSVVVIPASIETLRDDSDMELPGWRNPSNIFYVLGKFDIPGSFILINTVNMNISVVLPQQTERNTVFSGAAYNRTELKINHHLDHVLDLKDLADFVGDKTLHSPSKKFLKENSIIGSSVVIKYSSEVEEAFIESRFIKTQPELELLGYASQVASFVHSETQKAIHNWNYVSESKLAAYFAFVSTVCHEYLQAYNPIVGAGKHGAVLHFPTGNTFDGGSFDIPKNGNLQPLSIDLILIDAAGAYRGYASDLTRTYSRNHSSHHKKILTEIVLAAQLAGINSHKLGNMVFCI